jgi:ribosomal protein L11 methyltransferase
LQEAVDDMREAILRIGEEHDVSGLLVRGVVVTNCEHEDWADAWQAYSSLLRVGRRTVVRAPWYEYDPALDEILIEIEAGMAFGAGGHASTHQVMTVLEEELVPGARVLDVGTGTGILAILCVRLGAQPVDAVDIEPVAVQVARRNVERNGVVDIVRVELGSVGPGEPFQEEYALVVANILAQVFVDLASCLAKAVRAGGMLILGDIINFREVAVREAFAGLGLRVCRRDEMEGWVMLALRKPEV